MARGETRTACTHHWTIPPADGSACVGTCKRCGATRRFKNHMEQESQFVSKGIPNRLIDEVERAHEDRLYRAEGMLLR